MSILKELKEEVASKQKEEHFQSHIKQQCEQRYQQVILPTMQAIFSYMKELVEHLNYLEHTVKVEHYSKKYSQIGQLTQSDYSISTDNFGGFDDINQLRHVNVHFLCCGKGVYTYFIRSQGLIEQEVHFLNSRNIKFDWEITEIYAGIKTARFTITPKIPVRFRFEVDFDNSKILLFIDNHEDFGFYKHTFEPEEINEEFLDEIARLMLRKKSMFSDSKIPDSHRKTIQKMLEEKRREESGNTKKHTFSNNYMFDNNYDLKPSPLKRLSFFIKSIRRFLD